MSCMQMSCQDMASKGLLQEVFVIGLAVYVLSRHDQMALTWITTHEVTPALLRRSGMQTLGLSHDHSCDIARAWFCTASR